MRGCVVDALADELGKFANQPSINGFIVGLLTDLRAVERAKTIEEAYLRHRVDEEICGDWRDVQTELGLRPPRKWLSSATLDKLWDAVDGVVDQRKEQ